MNSTDPINQTNAIDPNEVTRETLVAVIALLARYIDWNNVAEEDTPLLRTFVDAFSQRNAQEK
jgi:hypothetical protein